ncbi:hypothetical protein BJ138DRAFT_1146690 [Hygrophoropsis aurantiaca]|uniref:Uncharacterized protein n=1 Tax=Hygrophoropsis aurantiaca TaxID=72124 RepID=A0ACB8AI73_9AGAM|nr:hypothetical protein BJ138DRAFT_1146690 [Hygrophoropsis aurantiaca]
MDTSQPCFADMNSTQLIAVNLTLQQEFLPLVRVLSPHVPFSLHILGGLLNSSARTEKLNCVDPSKIYAWSSMPLNNIDASSALFSIVIFSSVSHQFRFFCSAESASGPPTEAEEAHVVSMVQSVLQLAHTEAPKYDSVLKSVGPSEAPTERHPDEKAMIVIGAVHEKWQPCLRTLSAAQNPQVRYVASPSGSPADTLGHISDEWIVSRIQESDIDAVRGTSHIPRSKAYLLSRSAYSVCIRRRHEEGEDEVRKPIAWALMHADGSVGTLYVNTEYRGKGLAQIVMKGLVDKLNFRKGNPSLEDDDVGGGALGWNWADTDIWNNEGRRFFDSLTGWRLGWICHWTYMNVGSDDA